MKFLTTKPRVVITLLMLLVTGLTFALQSYNVGFYGWRHGWTSSHSLSIIRRAVPENRFVGYSLAFIDEDGEPLYEYFDRYPVFFSAGMNAILSLVDDLPTQIYLSRQVMNAILLATMFMGYRLVRLYVANRYLALGITVLSFSSYYFLYYKDMPDFHPPVIPGFLALFYSIARYKLYGERWQVYAVAVAAVLLAFGYTILFALAMWFVIDLLRLLSGRGESVTRPGNTAEGRLGGSPLPDDDIAGGGRGMASPLPERFVNVLRLDALWILVIGVGLSAGAIFYNVSAEAAIRGVPLAETSVVDSILRRIPFLETAVDDNARSQVATTGLSGWAQFFVVEFERVVKWTLPLKTGGDTGVRFVPGETEELPVNWWLVALGVPMAAATVWWITRQRGALRDVALITVLGPLVFLFSMINLTSVHDFVTMFALPVTLVVWMALLSWAGRYRMATGVIVVAAIGLYAGSSVMVRSVQQSELPGGAPYTYDFDRMRTAIDGEWNTVYLDYRRHNAECVVRNWQCYALGYYLGNNYLTHYPQHGHYVLSPRPYYATETFVAPGETFAVGTALNPENEIAYLMNMETAEPRTAPEDMTPLTRYGDDLRLHTWELRGDVTLPACGMVTVETWWWAAHQPEDALNMQIVMVDTNGERVTDANAPLGAVATSLWETGRFTVDVRPLLVPCDTPPGEYPLVMGVYDPETLEPVPVVDENGNPTENQMYLTTLFVQ
ncbi:MAG: hypothetical protein AAFV33_03160 [Chloroflexota bacterium]